MHTDKALQSDVVTDYWPRGVRKVPMAGVFWCGTFVLESEWCPWVHWGKDGSCLKLVGRKTITIQPVCELFTLSSNSWDWPSGKTWWPSDCKLLWGKWKGCTCTMTLTKGTLSVLDVGISFPFVHVWLWERKTCFACGCNNHRMWLTYYLPVFQWHVYNKYVL